MEQRTSAGLQFTDDEMVALGAGDPDGRSLFQELSGRGSVQPRSVDLDEAGGAQRGDGGAFLIQPAFQIRGGGNASFRPLQDQGLLLSRPFIALR